MKLKMFITALILFQTCMLVIANTSMSHCDTLGGPVVESARTALATGDVTPVLKWVRQEDEAEIRKIFNKVIAVRKQGADAKELADMYFFETLVRIHRAGEGAPYNGLKPASAVEPAIKEADRSLESGNVDRLVNLIEDDVEHGIRERFNRAGKAREHADESVEAGREYVESYVEFTHYVEGLHGAATGSGTHHGEVETHKHHQSGGDQ